MRIAIIGPYPISKNMISGGVESVINNLVSGFQKNENIELHVIDNYKSDRKKCVSEYENIFVHRILQKRKFGNTLFKKQNSNVILKKINEINPDIIHFHVLKNIKTNIPCVYTIHGMMQKELRYEKGIKSYLRGIIKSRSDQRVVNSIENLILISPYVKEIIGSKIKANYYNVPNPISDLYYNIKSNDSNISILTASNIIRRKNIMDLLKIIKVLKNKICSIKLLIAGKIIDEKYYKELQTYVANNNLEDNIIFLGQISEEELAKEYSKCILFVLSSLQETSSMSIQQAMAAGKPVVAYKVAGNKYLIKDKVTGFLINPGDVNTMAEKIFDIMNDSDMRKRISDKAKEEANRYKIENVALEICNIYKKIVSKI